VKDKSLDRVFESTVSLLVQNNLVDCTILHGDGSSTAAKKDGDMLGYNGHKHFKDEKVEIRRQWEKLGVSIEQDLHTASFGLTFVALDPDGHRIRVCIPDK
jgi:hypothetical protein